MSMEVIFRFDPKNITSTNRVVIPSKCKEISRVILLKDPLMMDAQNG